MASRKPSGLQILTPGIQSASFRSQLSNVPPTPLSVRPTARHVQSSPHLSLFSPSMGPEGGMQLNTSPDYAKHPGPSPHLQSHSDASSPVRQEVEFFSQKSEEAKSESYPNGPVCMHDPHVFLFREPTAEEARKYDVVVNVAKEVVNPFSKAMSEAEKEATVGSILRSRNDDIPEPQTSTSENSFKSAFENLPSEAPSRSTSPGSVKEPEYIHIPWEHKSEIGEELLGLCKLIDDRVQRGKTVLVHCQVGQNRSASLIIAYGLYKNPQLDLHDALLAAKKRSEWVDPSMRLYMQVGEFGRKLVQKPASIGNIQSRARPVSKATDLPLRAATAPAPREDLVMKDVLPDIPERSIETTTLPIDSSMPPPPRPQPEVSHTRNDSDQTMTEPSPEPIPNQAINATPEVSAKRKEPTRQTSLRGTRSMMQLPRMTTTVRKSPSFRDKLRGVSPIAMPPLPFTVPMQTTKTLSAKEESATPSLLSPRIATFTASPFHNTAAGDLAMNGFSTGPLSPRSEDDDPRSPATTGGEPITRSIFDVLK